MEPKLIACIMVGNAERLIGLCIDAVEPQVDKIIICYDTSSKDDTMKVIHERALSNDKIEIIQREYEHDLTILNANSNQRNFYLNYLKKNYYGDYCLCLDADEIVGENFIKAKEIIKDYEKENINIFNPRMVHFEHNFGYEDATKDIHYVIHRFFKITDQLYYPDGEHQVLRTKESESKKIFSVNADWFTIYHLAHCKEMFYIRDRYINHLAKSDIHKPRFLIKWYYDHITGEYPVKKFDITLMPKILKDYFMVDDDYWYFKDRNIDIAQIVDAAHWRDFFKPQDVLLVGDGKAIRTIACRIAGLTAYGFDISKYAVENNIGHLVDEIYWQDDVVTMTNLNDKYDLVVLFDILEHLDEKDLNLVMKKIHSITNKNILISVPMIGDPNLYKDPTHKIFWTRQQWENLVTSNGFKIIETPKYFNFIDQLIIGEKIDNS